MSWLSNQTCLLTKTCHLSKFDAKIGHRLFRIPAHVVNELDTRVSYE